MKEINESKFEMFLRKNFTILIIISILSFIFFSLLFFNFTVDDTLISLRYSKNIVENGIWNWNNSVENITEAYTSFTYAVLAILPVLLNISPLVFLKLFSLILFSIMVYQLYKKTDSLVIFFIGLVFTVFNPYFYLHSFSGLETILFIFLIFQMMYIFSKDEIINSKYEKYLFLIALLLPLTRPEGFLFSLAGAFVYFYIRKENLKSKYFLISIISLAIIYFVARYQYFGLLLPNPFYVKTGNGFSINRLVYSFFGLRLYSIPVLFIFFFFIFNNKYNNNRSNTNFTIGKKWKTITSFLIVSLFISIFLYGPSELQMDYANRFRFQLFIPVFMGLLFYLDKNNIPEINYMLIIATTLVFGSLRPDQIQYALKADDYNYSYKDIGITLSKFKDKNYTMGVSEAGYIPYYSELNCIDFIGLGDSEVAKNGLTIEYLEKKDPDIIWLFYRGDDPTSFNCDFESLFFHQTNHSMVNDHLIKDYMNNNSGKYEMGYAVDLYLYYLIPFVKKDISDFNEIISNLEEVGKRSRKNNGKSFINSILSFSKL